MLLDIGRSAESAGFSSLGTIGRVAFPSFEELVTLAALAGATQRIGLITDILLGPTRDPVLLAKQSATLDQVSGGRFVLGLGAGGRRDDFTASNMNFHDRGKRLDAALELMHQAWRGEPVPGTDESIAPRPINGHSVPLMFGGHAEPVVRRVVKYGLGYTLGGGNPETLKKMMDRVNAAWSEAGREGRPQFRALSYFAMGTDVAAEAEQNLVDYYGEYGPRIWAAAVKTPDQARERVKLFEAVGCDELIFFITAPAVTQVERLAEAVL